MTEAKGAAWPRERIQAELERVERLIEANFGEGDWYFTGTVEGPNLPTLDGMQARVRRFLRRVNYELRKRGLENARYVYVIEGWEEGSRQKRLHAHMILDGGLDRLTLKRIWGAGRAKVDELDPAGYGGLAALAKYLFALKTGKKIIWEEELE